MNHHQTKLGVSIIAKEFQAHKAPPCLYPVVPHSHSYLPKLSLEVNHYHHHHHLYYALESLPMPENKYIHYFKSYIKLHSTRRNKEIIDVKMDQYISQVSKIIPQCIVENEQQKHIHVDQVLHFPQLYLSVPHAQQPASF